MSKKVRIDNRVESYRSFFDHAWAKRILNVADGSLLDSLVFDLNLAWRGAANTHMLPWITLENLKAFADGFVKAREPFGQQLVDALADRIEAEMGDGLSRMRRTKLRSVIKNLAREIRGKMDATPDTFDADAVWKDYLDMPEFRMSVWGSQRLCYAGIYYAYEDFLIRCFKLVSKKPDYRLRQEKEFKKDFKAAFDAHVLRDCWTDAGIQTARLARHALVHNGGRVTKELASRKHDLLAEGGELQIMAPDTSGLYHLLKNRALMLVERALIAMK